MSRNVPGHSFAKRLRTALVALPLVTAGLVLIGAQPAKAEVHFVCTPAELVSAINASNASPEASMVDLQGCTVELTAVDNVAVGYGPTGLPTITSQISIINGTITRTGTTPFRLLHVGPDAEASLFLDQVTLSNGLIDPGGLLGESARGGTILNQGELVVGGGSIEGGTVRGGAAAVLQAGGDGSGGAVYNAFGATATLAGAQIAGSRAYGGAGADQFGSAGQSRGGAIFNLGRVNLDDVDIVDSAATGGDATGLLSGDGGAARGGAIYSEGDLGIADSTLSDGAADGGGATSVGSLTGSASGGLVHSTGDLSIVGSTLARGVAEGGPVVGVGPLASSGAGGAIFNSGNLALTNATVTQNLAAGAAPTEICGNEIDDDGNGQIDENCTIENGDVFGSPSTAGSGGGVYNSGAATFDSATVASNDAPTGGALYNDFGGSVTLVNSILADSAPTQADLVSPETTDTVVTVGANIVETYSGGSSLSPVAPLTDDPQLVVLAANGGPTQTQALGAGSPAVDTGDTDLTNDQRGESRPQGAADDIGAFELVVAVVDTDGDTVPDSTDNCPARANPDQANLDNDAMGDACDLFPSDPNNYSGDVDGDGALDNVDNCRGIPNPLQEDTDADLIGDICDVDPFDPTNVEDTDGDSVADPFDNCPTDENLDQANADGDAVGDACDVLPQDSGNNGDTDVDFATDGFDNCVLVPNPEQVDTDGDGIGDACDLQPLDSTNDPDDDGDGVVDLEDNCPDADNPGQDNADGDAEGDACDTDDDNDGVVDLEDNCPNADNAGQENADSDTEGDACDADADNDGVANAEDAFPLDPTESVDTDGDLTGDNADTDDDGDGVGDGADAFPLDPSESVDTDGDLTGDNADTDDDGDGVGDGADAFPLDPTESVDTDGDLIGDNADTDDDDDGVPDTEEYRDLLIQVRADLLPFSGDRNLRQGADLVAKAVAAKYWSSNGGFLVPKTADQARRLLRQAIDRLSRVTGPPATLAAAQAAITRIEDILAALA